jgi:class 3 adenylate cyclase/predicted ATPase
MDIEAWLRELGLERYGQAFRENEIDAAILPKLTADDLKDIGVTIVGHRRKLLEAIAALAEPALAPRAGTSAPAAAPQARPAEAERRQLTVMFVDLVGSTELAGRLDPEDLRDVMRAYQAACTGVVGRLEGHVAKYLGDGVLAYFGWPRAHEDDAERAVRAGLALAEAVGRLDAHPEVRLQARVGIATGHVVVGDVIGEGASREEAVVGDVPNLAARLQEIAEPGAVVIAATTRRLVGGLFELGDLGPLRLKGFAEPLTAFRVVGEGRAEGRFEALHGQHLTPLVGREQELAILLERWAWAKDGDGQVVLLAGEPGIGKSRLLRALRQELSGEPHLTLSHFCSPYHTNSALHPIIAQLERAAGFARGDGSATKRAKLVELLGQATEELDDAVPLIEALLGLPTDGRDACLNLTPQRQKQRTLEILIEQLAGLARDRPVLELYEDLHWVDPSTLELLDLLVEAVRDLPVLAILTYRPEFSPPWLGQAHVTLLPLDRLGRCQGAALVERVVGDKPLPAAVLEQIVTRTDGVPLFVEELTKTVLESGLLADAGDRYELSGPLPPLAIPSTLHDSLLARLDRLAPVKEVAQIGAVIGREFSHALLAAVADRPKPELRTALDQLVAAELIFRRGTPPTATYRFKHALVQDAAYQSLLKSKRQQLHARIAKALEAIPNAAERQPELLAHHVTEAGLARPAIDYWLKAGELAIRRSATTEAIAQLKKGLELAEGLSGDRDRANLELELQTALAGALIAARGFAAPETGEAYTRARELCRQLGQPPQLFRVLYGQYAFHLVRAELDQSLAIAKELLRAAKDQHETAPLVVGHRAVGVASFHRGELAAARAYLEQACALYDARQHRSLGFLYVFDPFVASASYLSCGLFALGHPEEARARAEAALTWARELAHPGSLALALHFACLLAQFVGDWRAVQEQADELRALASEQGFPLSLAYGTIFCGWTVAKAGQTVVGSAQLSAGLGAWQTTGAQYLLPYFLTLLAEADGCIDRVEDWLTEALARVERTGERWFEAELHRLKGQLLLTKNPAGAEPCFHQALAVAGVQGARAWELRAATSLARLWAGQNRRIEARDLLAPVYGWFTEGFDTADLKDAKALLDELA